MNGLDIKNLSADTLVDILGLCLRSMRPTERSEMLTQYVKHDILTHRQACDICALIRDTGGDNGK